MEHPPFCSIAGPQGLVRLQVGNLPPRESSIYVAERAYIPPVLALDDALAVFAQPHFAKQPGVRDGPVTHMASSQNHSTHLCDPKVGSNTLTGDLESRMRSLSDDEMVQLLLRTKSAEVADWLLQNRLKAMVGHEEMAHVARAIFKHSSVCELPFEDFKQLMQLLQMEKAPTVMQEAMAAYVTANGMRLAFPDKTVQPKQVPSK